MPQAIETLIEKLNNLESLLRIQKPDESINDLMDAIEAAEFLKISRSTLYAKTSKGHIPFRKMNSSNKVYFSRAELIAWLSQKE